MGDTPPSGERRGGAWAYHALPPAAQAIPARQRTPSSPALLNMAASAPHQQQQPSPPGGWLLSASQVEVPMPASMHLSGVGQGVGRIRVASRAAVRSPRSTDVSDRKDRFIVLPDTTPAGLDGAAGDDEKAAAAALTARGLSRLSVHAVAHAFSTRALRSLLDAHPELDAAGARWFPDDVLHFRWDAAMCPGLGLPTNSDGGECFVFAATGMVALWGLPTVAHDAAVLGMLSCAAVEPLDTAEMERDELQFQYSGSEQPSVRNDVITIAAGSASANSGQQAVAIKLAISHALAQSTMLAHYERRVMENVRRTAHIPGDLSRTGQVHLSRREILKLIGVLFTQKAEVNILSPLLDTPEFFWSSPDVLQALYKSLCVYLELEPRMAVINARLDCIEDLLTMLQNTVQARHSQKLEIIVIVLILVECIVGAIQCLDVLGFINAHHGSAGAVLAAS